MTDRLNITRRDFLNGVSLSLAAGTSLSPLQLLAMSSETGSYYPPALTGMRGSHAGSFEVAHAIANTGASYPRPEQLTDSVYDLIVVGGGISGLAAAKLFRDQAGAGQKILVLDNHDDFGGHAKRNEFEVDGNILLCHGGSQSLESPGAYSKESKQLLAALGIEPQRFYRYFDQQFLARNGLYRSVYFSAKHYGADMLRPSVVGFGMKSGDATALAASIATYPFSEQSKSVLLALLHEPRDYLPDMTLPQKIEVLRSISYSDFLRRYTGASEEVVTFLRDAKIGYWGFGFDALSALEGFRMNMPGLGGMGLDVALRDPTAADEPYIFHFPDGNASVARLLVRDLIPVCMPGHSMEDVVTAPLDYALLDRAGADVRIRLNSTAINVAHTEDAAHVDVTYVKDGNASRVRARHVILACYHMVIPHICAELPAAQREAIAYPEKTPLAYISIAVRNWTAFKKLGVSTIYQPQAELMSSFGLDFPVSIGSYQFTSSPEQPTVLHGNFLPTLPDRGLNQKQQHRAGRARLLGMSFDDFERAIIAQLDGALGAGGFDSRRDIAAITVNRWPHGYAYEYNDLYDPPEYNPRNGPHIAARARLGRISIANSDASAYAFVNGAIDAAVRAVKEQLA